MVIEEEVLPVLPSVKSLAKSFLDMKATSDEAPINRPKVRFNLIAFSLPAFLKYLFIIEKIVADFLRLHASQILIFNTPILHKLCGTVHDNKLFAVSIGLT